MSDPVLWETDGHIGLVTLNRPERLNALDKSMLGALEDIFSGPAAQGHIRALIITGAGDRAFAAGADIKAMVDMSPREAREWSLLGQRVFALIEDLGQPVIAAINGYALGGGCELTLACDIRLASEGAVLGQPEVTLGIPPGFGATYRLERVVGAGRARELILTGRRLDAAEALSMGLVSEVVPADHLMETATRRARALIGCGPDALARAKQALRRAPLLDRDDAVRLEADLFEQVFASGQPREGMSAFLEKRKADYV